jgi:hypothetical protein
MPLKAGATAALVLAFLLCASAHTKENDAPCKVDFSVVTKDQLGNIKQGLSEKQSGEIAKNLAKKYPGVCYVAPAHGVPLVFLVTISTATHHGTETDTDTSTQNVPVHGEVRDEYSQPIGTYDGTVAVTTTTESTVPVQFDYQIELLSIEQAQTDGTYKVLHRLQHKSPCPISARVCLADLHPFESLIEDGAKWLYQGGLNDPLQSVAPPN